MNRGRIYLSPPDLRGREAEIVNDIITSNWIAPVGPSLDQFERVLAERIGKKASVAVSSGTAAMHLALRGAGVTAGDRVFCSDLTFAGSCNPIIYLSAEPVFIDSEPESWNMSPLALEMAFDDARKQGRMPKAVIIVNLYGQSADMDALLPICEQYGVAVIEDAAESLGARYKGRESGSFGRYTILSFNGNKIITTSSGGMVLSDNEEDVSKCRYWATQAREPVRHYEHRDIGYNYRLSNVLAGIGLGQFQMLDEKIARRRGIYHRYREAFSDLGEIGMMPIPAWSEPNYWLSCLVVDPGASVGPADIMHALDAENIESRPVWKPMHCQPVFRDLPFHAHGERSTSEDLFQRGVCLPSGSGMSDDEQALVISVIRKAFGRD